MEAQEGQSLFYLCSEQLNMAQAKSHTWVGTLGKEQHVHLHTILFSLWFWFRENKNCSHAQEKHQQCFIIETVQ